MQLFIRTLQGSVRVVRAGPDWCVENVKQQLESTEHIPADQQILIFAGHLLDDVHCLSHCGLIHGSTVHLTARLVGGKGGFGALLRGQGRDGKLTTNFDACRDLSGRRLRHSNSEKRISEWQAQAAERAKEKAELQELKKKAKEEKRAQQVQVNVDVVKEEQRMTVERVQDAVQSALAGLKDTDTNGKRKAEEVHSGPADARKPVAKRPKMLAMLEEFSSDSDSEDDS